MRTRSVARARSARTHELADLFCRQARRRADALVHSLHDNDDRFNHRAAQKALGGRHSWLEEDVLDPADAPAARRLADQHAYAV